MENEVTDREYIESFFSKEPRPYPFPVICSQAMYDATVKLYGTNVVFGMELNVFKPTIGEDEA